MVHPCSHILLWGAGSNIGKNCSVASGISIWPQKNLEDDSQCCENIIWDEQRRKPESALTLKGFADFDITPEYAARVGVAFAATMHLPAEVAIVTDGSQQAVMLKYAVIAGVVSQGVDLYDMGLCGYSAYENSIRSLKPCRRHLSLGTGKQSPMRRRSSCATRAERRSEAAHSGALSRN